jgi:hypothetical protein
MTSGEKWAPVKRIAIVALPHDALLLIEEDHTLKHLKQKLRQSMIFDERKRRNKIQYGTVTARMDVL